MGMNLLQKCKNTKMAHRVKSRLRGPPIFLLLLCAYWTNGEANQLDCQVEELEKSLDRALGGAQQKQQQLDSLNQGLEKLKRKVSLILFRSRCRVLVASHRGRRGSTEKLGRFWAHRLNIAIAMDMSDSRIYDSLNQGIAEGKNHFEEKTYFWRKSRKEFSTWFQLALLFQVLGELQPKYETWVTTPQVCSR